VARPHPVLRALAAGRVPAAIPERDDGLLRSAIDHGMHGLLWTWVREHEPAYSGRARLAGLDAATRHRHGRLWDVLAVVRDRLAGIGVDVVTVKGVTAEARWYDRPGERPSSDVDVLVAPDVRAGAVLRVLDRDHPLVDAIDDLVRSGAVQSADLHVDGVAVDLHFDLLKLGYPMRDPAAVWQRTQAFALADGSTVRVLDPELALVHFLVHANKDSFPRLLGCADVVRVMRGDLDWDVVGRILHDEGLEDVAACALETVARAVGVPSGPLRTRSGLRARAWHAVWPERVTLLGSAGTSRSRRQEALPFLVRGRGRDAVRAAVRIVLPPRAAVAQRYADIPGSYLGRLARGRARTMAERRASLRARHAPPPAHPPAVPPVDGGGPVDGVTKAGLLRARLRREPLWLDVSGRSMGWSIPGGARVRVEGVAAGPRRGEVWAYCTQDGSLVVHRARRASAHGHVFQGDTCIRADDPVPTELLVGRVVEVAPARRALGWGAAAGAVQRLPRVAVAAAVRAGRGVRAVGAR